MVAVIFISCFEVWISVYVYVSEWFIDTSTLIPVTMASALWAWLSIGHAVTILSLAMAKMQ